MNSRTALVKLQDYKKFEEQDIQYKGRTIRIDKVVAAPHNLPEFMDYYLDYLSRNEEMATGDGRKYDIYFLIKAYSDMWTFIRLDEFQEGYAQQ